MACKQFVYEFQCLAVLYKQDLACNYFLLFG